MTVTAHRSWPGLLIGSAFLLQMAVLWTGFAAASGDDFVHALLAYEWSTAPFLATSSFGFASINWLPPQFWIGGLTHWTGLDLATSLRMSSIVAGLLELVGVFYLTAWLFDRRTAVVALALVAFLPWKIWLNLSMTEMPLYYASIVGACCFFVRWLRDRDGTSLLLTATGFLVATMFRPDAWLFAGLFSAIVLLDYRRARSVVSTRVLVTSVTIPWLFVAIWLGYNFMQFGSPTYFLENNRQQMSGYLSFGTAQQAIAVLQYPFFMFTISPVLLVLITAGVGWALRQRPRRHWLYLCLVLGQLGVLVLAALYGVGTSAAPQRYVLVNMVLLTPFAAWLAVKAMGTRYGRVCMILLLAFHVLGGVTKAFHYREEYRDTAQVGRYLKAGFESGRIAADAQIATEVTLWLTVGRRVGSVNEFFRATSEHAALEVFSDRPRNFVRNILQVSEADLLSSGTPSDTTLGQDELARLDAALAASGATRVVLRDRRLLEWIPDRYLLEATVGPYAVLAINGTPAAPAVPSPRLPRSARVGRALGGGLTLVGYEFRGGLFPGSVLLHWNWRQEARERQVPEVRLSLTFQGDPAKVLTVSADPMLARRRPADMAATTTIADEVSFRLPLGMPNGNYSVTLEVIDHATDTMATRQSIGIGTVTLVSSKRDALRDMITGGDIDWLLLAKVLLVV